MLRGFLKLNKKTDVKIRCHETVLFPQILLETQRWIVATRTSTGDCSVRRPTGKNFSKIIA